MARIFDTDSQSFHYIKLVSGKFRENAAENAENATKRTDKNGNEKWEYVFSKLEGYITSIKFVDSDYGEIAEILFADKEEKNLLQMQSKNYLFRNILKRLPLLDPKKSVTLSVWKPKDSEFSQMGVFQERESVKNFFKEDNKLPQGLEIPGEKYRNYHAQLEYLKENAVKPFLEKLGDWKPTFEVVHPTDASVPSPTQKDEPVTASNEDEDLPF